jgi:hypothetical protein
MERIMKEYGYILNGIDYMLNEKSYHEILAEPVSQADQTPRNNRKAVSLVCGALLTIINLIIGR